MQRDHKEAIMANLKRQHYVPQTYLRRFTNEQGKLFVYDKLADKVFASTPADVAQERLFYDFPARTIDGLELDIKTVEKRLGNVETYFGPLLTGFINAADNCGGITHDQIADFSPFVIIQWMRTKSYREAMRQIAEGASQSLIDKLVEANFPGGSAKISLKRESLPLLHAEHLLNPEKILELAHELDRHLWVIGTNNTPFPFFTSDHPVIRRANQHMDGMAMVGINMPGVEFVFPLSSRHILLIMERTHFAKWRKDDTRAVQLTSEQVTDYNRLQVMRSSQRLFCSIEAFDLAREVCQQHPHVCDPNRPRVKVAVTDIKDMKNQIWVTALE